MPREPLLRGYKLAVRLLTEIATFKNSRLKVRFDGAFGKVETGP